MNSSSPVLAPAAPAPVCRRNPALLAGGYFSLAFAVFQVSAIWWPAKTLQYFGGPVKLSLERPLVYAGLCLAFAVLVAAFGLYALSGAGQIGRLPLLRTGLITATAIYLLRGLIAVPQAPLVLQHPDMFRYFFFSLVALTVGIVHVCGVIGYYRRRQPGKERPPSAS